MKSLRLNFTVFTTGASVMMVEILASRIMAPYYGSSTYVWSALIGIILASLSVGYYYGGRLADRNPSEKKLSGILVVSGLAVVMIPLFKEIVFIATIGLGVKLGSIIAPLMLLSLPAVLLGMVLPYAIKLTAEKLDNIGSTTGNLYALSTLGSIFGTLFAGFVLIPYMKISTIFFAVSLLLFISSILMLPGEKKIGQKFLVVLVFLLILFYNEPYYGGKKLLHREYTPYNQILVLEDAVNRYLSLDGRNSGAIRLDTGYSALDYINYFEIPFLINPSVRDVLIAGEGTGVGAVQIRANHPATSITISEIDPRVHDIAVKYFGIKEDDKLRVVTTDVRLITKQKKDRYDYIILDAYNSRYSVPYYIVTEEFFAEIADILNPDGMVLLNVISSIEGPKSHILQSIIKTISNEFEYLSVYPVGRNTTSLQNVILVVSNSPIPSGEELRERVKDTEVLNQEQINYMLDKELEHLPALDAGIVLTDDYSPVDHLYLSMLD